MVLVVEINIDAYPVMAFSNLICHFEEIEVFSGGNVLPVSEET